MPKNMKASPKKEKKKSKLIVRLLLPMLLLVLFQIVTFFIVMIAGGEFSYVRQYAYNTLAEKTENRKNYIESDFRQKSSVVNEYADKINENIKELLTEKNAEIADIRTDKQLDRLIMESSLNSIIDLLRLSMSNDVYLILDTGDLYRGEDGSSAAKAALYLRDLDTKTDTGYDDLLMEMGFSSISQKYGIMLDSGWTLHFEPDPENVSFDFYYKTIETAQANNTLKTPSLGYWSGFSNLFHSASASMKYTVPLIAEDGTVYGVMGIGLTENTVLSNLPVNDFQSEDACYVLGRSDTSDDRFDIITHSGIVFNLIVGNTDYLQLAPEADQNVCDFTVPSDSDPVGSVQSIRLYSPASPYFTEQWALISVADRSSVLSPLNKLINMLILSAAISVIVAVLVVILSSHRVAKPISDAIGTMNSNREYSQIIRFEPSNIYEIDKLTDAITQLQINVHDFSSQVSKMIRIANVGLGTFLYDRTDDSVFVGQSLFRLMRFETQPEEDVIMSRQSFLEKIIDEETRQTIAGSLEAVPTEEQNDYTKEYSIVQEDGSTAWLRLSLVYNKNNSIGILQDITSAMTEKKRIEYERDYDIATGLLNRRAYYQQIDELFRDPGSLGVTAFIMFDLDNLKYVNDTYGHDFGDDYIKTAANVFKNFQNYGGIVSHLSGDEFNVCLPGFSSKEEIRGIIRKVRELLLMSYCLLPDGTRFRIRASAGVAWYPDDSVSSEMLMKYADFTMYTVKHSAKGEIAEFDRNSYEKDSVLITGVEEMNRIIDECSVRYAFHSIVSAKTGEIYGYEALMRPQSAILKSPLELLRIAKTGARLYEIERLTWTKALEEFQAQIDAGNIAGDSHIFINSISNTALEPSDADAVEEAHKGLLSQIVLEILESENVNEDCNSRKMRRMKKWNAQIALDDFGTGYNSEYALITMDPDIIKIDRSIISGCDKDISRHTIISNLVKLVHKKNVLVLAEGVETESELKTVISCGVDLLQGYYISRPVFEPKPIAPETVETIRRLAESSDGSCGV